MSCLYGGVFTTKRTTECKGYSDLAIYSGMMVLIWKFILLLLNTKFAYKVSATAFSSDATKLAIVSVDFLADF